MLKKIIFLLNFWVLAFPVFATKVNYPYLGIQFDIPQGWQGAEDEEAYILQSATMSGAIIVMLNEATTLQQLKTEADQGINDGWTTSLTRSSDFIQVGAEGLGAEFSGLFDGVQAKAFVIGLINPFGRSVTIGAVTTKQDYSEDYQEVALELANSIAFALPEESQQTKDWRQSLPGASLTYLSKPSGGSSGSYVDSTGMTFGTYSYYSKRVTIQFCNRERFTFYSSTESSFDAGSGFGGTNSSDEDRGSWRVESDSEGNTQLILQSNSGSQREYSMTREEDKTFLNNERFYRGNANCH